MKEKSESFLENVFYKLILKIIPHQISTHTRPRQLSFIVIQLMLPFSHCCTIQLPSIGYCAFTIFSSSQWVHNCRINKTILNVFLIENLSTSSRRRQSNKVFFSILLLPLLIPSKMPFLCAHTNIQTLSFFAYIAQGVGWRKIKGKENFLRYRFFSLSFPSFFFLFLLYHFIYTFRKKTSTEGWVKRNDRKEIFLIQQMLVVYNTHRKASGTRKIFFNIKLYSFTSVDNSCFFISWPDIFLSLRNYFHLLYSSVPFNRMRLSH